MKSLQLEGEGPRTVGLARLTRIADPVWPEKQCKGLNWRAWWALLAPVGLSRSFGLNGQARRVRGVQELRRLGRAGSAWLEAIRPDQVRHGGAALRIARRRGGSAAQI